MKKLIYLLCSLAVVFTACGKPEVGPDGPEGPDDKPTGKGEFVLTSEAAETIDEAGGDITVRFTSTVDWAASLDVATDVATLNIKSGSAEDNFVKVTVKPFAEKNATRVIKLTLKPDGLADVVVTITQNGAFEPFFTVNAEDLAVPAAGGEVTFTISTNTEFNVKTYDEFEEWAHFTIDGTNCKFTVDANPEFGAREAYVKFTVPAFQVPVLDDEGKETGETEDKAFRVYLTQEGLANLEWIVDIPDDVVASATNYTLAVWKNTLLMSNGPTLYLMSSETGVVVTPMDLGLESNVLKGIVNDDAGNLLLLIDGLPGQNAIVVAFPAEEDDTHKQKTLLNYPNEMPGKGLNNIKVKGDVYGQAVVTMFQGGVASASEQSACLYWNVGDGNAAWTQKVPGDDNSWITPATGNIVPNHVKTADVWDSYRCFFAPVGSQVGKGFVFNGYEGQYKFLYHNGTAWNDVLSTPYTWETGVNSFANINWGGEDYSVAVGMSYFPIWAIASDIWLMRGDGSSLETIVRLPYSGLTTEGLEGSIYSYTPAATDVVLNVEENKLAAYVIDGSLKVILKYTFSK